MRSAVIREVEIPADFWQSSLGTDGASIYRMAISSPDALNLRLSVDHFSLAAGEKLSVFSNSADSPQEFERDGPLHSSFFWTTTTQGDTVYLEYSGAQQPKFFVRAVAHGYRDLLGFVPDPTLAASCNLDVMCYPDLQPLASSTALLLFAKSDGIYGCTATLINNATLDYSPLMLTADHCISDESTANTAEFHFFYTSAFCGATNTTNFYANTSTYAHLLAHGAVEGSSDFSLLSLQYPPPDGVTYAAWSTDPLDTGVSATGIHHPKFSFRRVAFGRTTFASALGLDPANFVALQWQQGITEPGSSGSGIYDSTGRLRGTLTGGRSSCSNPSGPDFYGRFSTSGTQMVDASGRNYLQQGLADDQFDPNHSREQAADLPLGNAVPAILKKSVDDWFKITVPAFSHAGFFVYGNTYEGVAGLEVFENQSTEPAAPSYGYVGTSDFSSQVDYKNPTAISTVLYAHVFLKSGVRSNYGVGATVTLGQPPAAVITDPDVHGTFPDLVIGGTINPNGTNISPSMLFATNKYVKNSAFAVAPGGILTGNSPISFSVHLPGLEPATYYYYTAEAFNVETHEIFTGDVFNFATPGGPIAVLSDNFAQETENHIVGYAWPTRQVTLFNPGDQALSISAITMSPELVGSHNCPATLPTGHSCTFTLSLMPLKEGLLYGNLTITHNGKNGSSLFLWSAYAFDVTLTLYRPIRSPRNGADALLAGGTLDYAVQVKAPAGMHLEYECHSTAALACRVIQNAGNVRVLVSAAWHAARLQHDQLGRFQLEVRSAGVRRIVNSAPILVHFR